MPPRIGTVVVTHRSGERVAGLLSSLARHEPEVQVVIVDSGSPEGPPHTAVPVLALEKNVGFGTACNRGVAFLLDRDDHDFLCMLNPDVRLQGATLRELTRELQERPNVGIATGPMVDPSGERQPAAWGQTSPLRALWFATGWQFPRLRRLAGRLSGNGLMASSASLIEDEMEIDGHVLGGAMVVRRECWNQLGGFDESYFLYWEDAELCQRARELGWKLAVLPCTPIIHDAGTSSSGVTSDDRWHWYVEGAQRFADRHLSAKQADRLITALRVGRFLRRRR